MQNLPIPPKYLNPDCKNGWIVFEAPSEFYGSVREAKPCDCRKPVVPVTDAKTLATGDAA